MEWCDDAIVLGLKLHGETSVIAELLTQAHGRHSGFIHGGRSRRLRPVLQPGNTVRATWKARSEEQLGTLTLEPLVQRAARLMESALALHGANLVCALLRLLPEREPQPELYSTVIAILDRIDDARTTPAAIVHLEIMLLRELGFGLDLGCCAVTGATDDLAYVSPKTGRAVSKGAGAPYAGRIFPLPAFLLAQDGIVAAPAADVAAGFLLAEHFLNRDVFQPRGLTIPDCRRAYIRAVEIAAA
ncbi:DNA repair protein RecO [Lichenifustis flavocetrariae]|uniref:DNA repair protein RecO n=1 Tax=Lichenifustis flavocetrariae TaxID=2949735 RepID=A0AA41Z578_9HYPH|nr:DNA repair protein RecO [Lichenifustis flavocetrariae]MCW6510703.1 DNA repair protein RecO [Lichenifustis flavocetrariae]